MSWGGERFGQSARGGVVMATLVFSFVVSDAISQTAGDPIGALLMRQGLQAAPAPQRTAMPVVIGVELSETSSRTRFLLELSDPIEVKTFSLSNPDRLVVDLPEVLWRVSSEARPLGNGAVRSYRYGLFRKGNSRFVIDLNSPAKFETPQLLPPDGVYGFRLVLDLTPTTQEAFAENTGWPEAQTQTAAPVAETQRPAPAPARNGAKKIIVVDAGHGGLDPGTHGKTGLQEKDIVLAVAKELRRSLEATGRYSVHLTRDSDVFIPLRERVSIARAAHGDLFVSLHADSNDRRSIRGASVYTLSESASDKEAGRLADKENMSDVIAGVDLSGENSPVASILIDLAQRDTMNRSARFAETVVSALPVATAVSSANPHRSAGFAVLKAPDIPSALIELGYLSNAKDEGEMSTGSWRGRVAQAVARAIDRHFSNENGNLGRKASNP